MIASPSVSKVELESFATVDPAVKSGLLTFEVKPCYVSMAR